MVPPPSAYAMYFDYHRRSSPEFRRELRRGERRRAREEKEEANALNQAKIKDIHAAVQGAQAEGFPEDAEDKQQYFMAFLAEGEMLAPDRKRCPPPGDGTILILLQHPKPSMPRSLTTRR